MPLERRAVGSGYGVFSVPNGIRTLGDYAAVGVAEQQPIGAQRAAARTGPRAALALIRRREFAPYFFGNALNAIGTWFQSLAAGLFVWEQTHSSFLLGVLSF